MKNIFLIVNIMIISCTETSLPPDATKKPHKITVHGDTRVDSYYWMRLTDKQKSAKKFDSQTSEVVDYITTENEYTQSSLNHTKKFQNKLFEEIVGRIKKDDVSVPYLDNGYYYYTRYEKGREYAIRCRKKGSLDSPEEIILDENKLAEGYDYFAVSGMNVSPDNEWLAFGVDTLSRRFYEVHFKNLRSGDILEQTIPNTTGGVAWANDNQTVFYTSKNKITLLSEKIYRHKMGSDFHNDELVYTENDEAYYIGVSRSKSGEYIIIYNSSTLVSDYHILRADVPDGKFKNFSLRGTAHEYSIDHYQNKFYIITNWNAKNNRLMETAENATDISQWKEVIAHRDDVHLLGLEIFKDHLVINERKDGLRGLRIINQKTGDDADIDFEEETYTARISVNEEFNTNILRYSYTSMVTPSTTYDYNMDTGEKTLMKQQEIVGGYDQKAYHSERLYATAQDGKRIPISLVYRKDMKSDSPQNLLLYAYGSYGSTRDPGFGSSRLSILDRGFIYAIAHVRGSQIYGRQSYDDGKMLNKKNTFTDFVDAGIHLVNNGYTNSEQMFCEGGSAGGLLIGAVVNLAPELWRGAIAAVPFVDVVTTMLDPSIPLTSNEWDEWGDPRIKKYYDYMLSYSPYDQVRDTAYPNMLVTSGFFDSQVQYWEPLKYVAKLRDHWQGENKLYLHMNMDAGHGGKSGRFRRYREVALEYAFMLDLVGVHK
ncbi:MAG TPA: S9 family peptidase [Candidatus Marinimicrobia bacterium]|jgi:oligopeptidase B|nr:S9 family peptidase [Candidatus Neomarinimicrobiota bacterium]HIB34266.1 S9 family peptidase [Candidatus Neomarinimicrobiota bacterium]